MTSPIRKITFEVNGKEHQVESTDDEMLIDYLHDELRLTGTKFGCGIGSCRACTVLVSRADSPARPTLACSTPVRALHGLRIETIEGQADPDGKLSPVQEAFLDGFAFQCGYCTPGMVMASTALIRRIRRRPPATKEIPKMVDATLGGHYCRCTGYSKYRAALAELVAAEGGKGA